MTQPSPAGPDSLEQLIYISVDTRAVTNPIRAADILAEARRNNARDDITGVLTFTGGRFVQVLEGRCEKLDDLLDRLSVDTRHRDMEILDRRAVSHRTFAEWDMVSPRLARAQINRLEDLLAQASPDLGALVDILTDAVHQQSAALGDYGYDPSPAAPESWQDQSPPS